MHATTSPKIIDQQPATLAVLAALVLAIGIALGAVMDLDLGIASAPAAVSAPDTSYNAVEGTRARFGSNSVTSYEGARARLGNGDASYDTVEGTRAQLGVDAPDTKFGKSGYISSAKNGEQVAQPERDGRFGHGWR